MVTLLSPYLLSSQGDRVSLAHGVEGRYPFLDHRLFEFAARLPTRSKLRGLREKDILRRWARQVVPPAVVTRPKQPYRAPDIPAFFSPEPVEYAQELLDATSVTNAGLFDPRSVAGLMQRCRTGVATVPREPGLRGDALNPVVVSRVHASTSGVPRRGDPRRMSP